MKITKRKIEEILSSKNGIETLNDNKNNYSEEFIEKFTDAYEEVKRSDPEFEKALISNRRTVLEDFAKKKLLEKGKDKKSIMEDIKNLNTSIENNEYVFLEDLISEKLGITITESEFKNIISYTDKTFYFTTKQIINYYVNKIYSILKK